MATPSPFEFLDRLAQRVGDALQPPDWFVHEAQRRVVLLLNHVLMQEPEAQARLMRHKGRVVEAHWRKFRIRLVATPAGLLDLATEPANADLTLTLTEESPLALTQSALRGDKPPVRIAGDVQFAAEINWLVDHVRWDLEEDLARVFGDAPAHAIAQGARTMADALRRFVPGASGTSGTSGRPPAPPSGPAR